MPAMKSNKLAKCAHARIVPRRLISVVSNPRAHGLERSLPEQAIDKRRRGRLIIDEPVVPCERNPEIGGDQRDLQSDRLTAALRTPRVWVSLNER